MYSYTFSEYRSHGPAENIRDRGSGACGNGNWRRFVRIPFGCIGLELELQFQLSRSFFLRKY